MKAHLQKIFLCIIFFTISVANSFSETYDLNDNIITDRISYDIESHATFSGGENTPFWLVSNLYGLGSPEFNNGWVRGKIQKNLNPQNKFSWGGGIDLVGGWNLVTPFRIQQLYGEIKYRKLWIIAGSKEFHSLYNNSELSSGDLLFSQNSMPIPQLRIGTYGFAPFWGSKGWFSVKAYLAYGKFTDSRWMKNWVIPGTDRTSDVLFCSRGLWFRFGNESKFPLTADIGIEMGTQFGGTIYKDGNVRKMPNKFIDWVKAFIPLPGNTNTPTGEQTNVQGNMTGEYNIAVSYSPTDNWDIKAYFEHFFEDHSQMFLEYGPWKDGLWGLELTIPKNRFISKFVYEFVATKDQTGAVNHDWTPEIPEQVSGRDGYFSHYLYRAWQNWGMTIGTPLAISPIYNKDHLMVLYNTRFYANHFGLEGNPTNDINWRILLTFSRNWGTYWRPLTEVTDSFSGLLELNYSPKWAKGWKVKGALAIDRGQLLGNNFGGMVSLAYEGDFFIRKN
ncbi:MAG: hypothetical protein J1E95_03610 [Muribaculaceae bacterium]|nr:hypothetical protein [Muribaculaceae bacterium]